MARDSQLPMARCTGCPKKMPCKSIVEFKTLGGVFLGVKNNSENFVEKNIELLIKILSK